MHAGCRGCAQCVEDTGWVLRTPACHVEDLNSMERMWAGCRGHTVLCHHSPRWISLTVRQDPLYSDGDLSLYMQHAFYNHANHHSHPHHFFHPPFTSSQYLLLSKPSHLQATSSAHSQQPHLSHLCIKGPTQPHSSYHFGEKPWNVVESETMEILSGDKVPLRDNKGATGINFI